MSGDPLDWIRSAPAGLATDAAAWHPGPLQRVRPAALGAAAFWEALAGAAWAWHADRSTPWVLLVPRCRLIAPLQHALRAHAAATGQPWVPPAVRTVTAWREGLAPGGASDRLGLTLRLHRAITEALPERAALRAPAEQLAFARGLGEVLEAWARREASPDWEAEWAAVWGAPAGAGPLGEDLALIRRLAAALGDEVQATVAADADRARRAAAAWARRGGRVVWIDWQRPGSSEQALWHALAVVLPESDRLALGIDWAQWAEDLPGLAAAWPEGFEQTPAELGVRRAQARQAGRQGVPRIAHSHDREAEAQWAAQWVVEQLQAAQRAQQPLPRLAIVALDRWLARRVRALLERAAVLLDDREGWLVSTTVAATAVLSWLDVVASEGHHDDLLAWLESRFVRVPEHAACVRALERAVTGQRYVRGWTGLLNAVADAAAGGATEAWRALHAHAQAGRRTQSLSAHLAALEAALRAADVPRRLACDAAGRQVLGLLDRLRRTAVGLGPGQPMDAAEFRAICVLAFEQHRFFGAVESPVVLTSPREAAGGAFEAVLVLGAAQGSLPAPVSPLPLVNEPLRAWLGLPTAALEAQAQQRDLLLLCALTPQVVVTCRSDPAEGVAPSPWLERLQVMLADDPAAGWADCTVHAGVVRTLPARPCAQPALPLARLPARLSVGSIQRLLDCPYRFLVRDGWRLTEAREAIDDPGTRERGELVHEILYRWHAEWAAAGRSVHELGAAERRASLVAVTDAVAERELAQGGALLAQIAEWRALLDPYLAWLDQDAPQAWQWRAGEQEAELVLPLAAPTAQTVRIHGRLDRLDEGPAGWRVLDYKLGQRGPLERDVEAPEQAAQLALYAWMAGTERPVTAAGYLSLRREGVAWLGFDEPVSDIVADWQTRLQARLTEVATGLPLSASGQSCAHCSSRGLCRKGHWS